MIPEGNPKLSKSRENLTKETEQQKHEQKSRSTALNGRVAYAVGNPPAAPNNEGGPQRNTDPTERPKSEKVATEYRHDFWHTASVVATRLEAAG